jgi:hypothetical protein
MLQARELPLRARIRRTNVKGTGNQSSGISWSKQKAATQLSVTANCEIRLLFWVLSVPDCR